jgi:hypothetical protein
MLARLIAAAGLVCIAAHAAALETAQWPPPEATAARMRELQQVIIDRESTPTQREAAREELAGLLKSPAGQQRGRTPDEKPARPPRAAIDPFPSVVKPVNIAPTPAPPATGVAHVDVVVPPKVLLNPQSGSVIAPSGRFAVDPLTGNVLHDVGTGFVDPRTGQFIPR